MEEKQALQLQEVEKENRRKHAKTKLTELKLTDDMYQATDKLRETLSHITKNTKQITSQGVSDWVNEVNEPESVSNQSQTSTVVLNNVAGSFNPASFPYLSDVIQMRQATLPVRSSTDVIVGQDKAISPIRISSVPTILKVNSTPSSLSHSAFNPLPFINHHVSKLHQMQFLP